MTERTIQRRLVVILAADVAGYSRLVELDETGTLEALKARRRSIFTPLASSHNGRIVKWMGDGVLVEFLSAVDAVQFALRLAHEFNEANRGVGADRQILLR